MPAAYQVQDQNLHSTGILLEDWPNGRKVTVAGAEARTVTAFSEAAIQVKNKTSGRIWVRCDDGAAADDGTGDLLEPNEVCVYGIQSSDGTISLLGVPSNTGSVYLMPVKGLR